MRVEMVDWLPTGVVPGPRTTDISADPRQGSEIILIFKMRLLIFDISFHPLVSK